MKLLIQKIATVAILALWSVSAGAQVNRCAVVEHEQYLEKMNPKRSQQRAAFEQKIQQYAASLSSQKITTPTISIPVVVHVLYSTGVQNISDAQVLSQIEVLNEDFARLNSDTANTPVVWQGISSSPNVSFCMAQVDPNGNPTNGIERRQTTTGSFSTNDNIKHFSTGGLDAWDPSSYFNIWVGNLSGGLLGYAEFPTGSLSTTYGVVITYDSFGRGVGTLTPPYNLGRTATHEIGHCLNLFHIWGDDGGACTGTDNVADTPNQGSENYGCPNYPLTDNCSGSNPGVMFMNYMDYTDDGCMNMFTQGQVTRMLAVLNNGPYNALLSSTVCTPTSLVSTDAAVPSIQSPSGNLCTGTVTPQITLKNQGIDTLTSVTIYYQLDATTPLTYAWTGSLPSLSSTAVTLPSFTANGGAHTLTIYTSLPNNTNDLNTANDTAVSAFNVVGLGMSLPYQEGFENGVPGPNMLLVNPDGGTTWEQTSTAAHSGISSAMVNNYDYNANGEIDEIILPNLNLTSVTGPKLSFYLAYRLYTDPTTSPNFSDTLQILISTDCGATFNSIYKKFGTALVTTPAPYFTTAAYVPIASHWRRDSIDLAAFSSFNNVVIKFRNITDYENYIYLDDINIDGLTATGLNQDAFLAAVRVYPNPFQDQLVIDLSGEKGNDLRLRLLDATGRMIYSERAVAGGGLFTLKTDHLEAGYYLVELNNGKEQRSFPVIKQ